MTDIEETSESQATILCKSCGLCCTGYLFIWTKLKSAELDSAQALGLTVFREPEQRGFNQPCPLWRDQCTIYDSPHYPYFCRTYKCKLLKQVLDEVTPLHSALTIVRQTKGMIRELKALLPESPHVNFRQRLVARIEREDADLDFRSRANELLALYEKQFGVKDLSENDGE